jgi:hypothetical protein
MTSGTGDWVRLAMLENSVPTAGSLMSVRRVRFGHRVTLDLGDPRLVPVLRRDHQTGFVVIIGLDDEPCVVNAILTPEISMCEVVRTGLSEDLVRNLAGRFVRIVGYLDQETLRHPAQVHNASRQRSNRDGLMLRRAVAQGARCAGREKVTFGPPRRSAAL